MKITIQMTKQAREFLVGKGFDPAFGARPLKRALQKFVEDPIAEEILRNKFSEQSIVKIKFNKKTEDLRFVEGNPVKKLGVQTEEPESEEVS